MNSRESSGHPTVLDDLLAAQNVAGDVSGDLVSIDEQQISTTKRIQRFLNANPIVVTIGVLLLSIAFFSVVVGSKFSQPLNQSLILQQVQIVGILALAQGIVVLTAGIDLSVGYVMLFCSIIAGRLAVNSGLPSPLSVLVAVAAGALCGLLTGTFISRVKLPPFIVTLAFWYVVQSLLLYYSKSETLRNSDIQEKADGLLFMGKTIGFGQFRVTYGVFLMIAMYAIAWYALNYTAWGRHIYATGDNEDAALLTGVRTKRVVTSAYVVGGIIAAIAGWVLIARTGSVSPRTDPDHNLNSITAVVIGGISLFGGRGNIWGAFFGALIVGVFKSGLVQFGLDVLWVNFALGLLILGAASLDRWIRKAGA